MTSGNFSNSIQKSFIVLQKDEKNINALNVSALSYFLKGDHDKAVIYFNKIYDIEPKNVDNLVNIAMMYKSLKKYNEAKKFFSEALIIESSNDLINAELGIIYYNLKNITAGITIILTRYIIY